MTVFLLITTLGERIPYKIHLLYAVKYTYYLYYFQVASIIDLFWYVAKRSRTIPPHLAKLSPPQSIFHPIWESSWEPLLGSTSMLWAVLVCFWNQCALGSTGTAHSIPVLKTNRYCPGVSSFRLIFSHAQLVFFSLEMQNISILHVLEIIRIT